MTLTGRLSIDMVKFVNDGLVIGEARIGNDCKNAASHKVAVQCLFPDAVVGNPRADGTVDESRGHGDGSGCMAKAWIMNFKIFCANGIEAIVYCREECIRREGGNATINEEKVCRMGKDVCDIVVKAIAFGVFIRGNWPNKSVRPLVELDAKCRSKNVRVSSTERWA